MATAGLNTHHQLQYEQQILGELTEEDGLCITAAGIGWFRVVAAMLSMHDSHQNGESTGLTHHGSLEDLD